MAQSCAATLSSTTAFGALFSRFPADSHPSSLRLRKKIMIHQPLGGAQGGQSDIDLQANVMLHHKANLNRYLSYHTGQTLEKINQDTDCDFFMGGEEAKDYGLIDGVIMSPHKILQPIAAAAD